MCVIRKQVISIRSKHRPPNESCEQFRVGKLITLNFNYTTYGLMLRFAVAVLHPFDAIGSYGLYFSIPDKITSTKLSAYSAAATELIIDGCR
jgi:hypothetical protein